MNKDRASLTDGRTDGILLIKLLSDEHGNQLTYLLVNQVRAERVREPKRPWLEKKW